MTKKKQRNIVKRQHTVQRYYLNGFADEKKMISVYDTWEKKYFTNNTKNISISNGIYTTNSKDNPMEIECDILANVVEAGFVEFKKNVLTKQVLGNNNCYVLTNNHDVISEYIYIQLVRTPKYLDSLKNRFNKETINIINDMSKEYGIFIPNLKQLLHNVVNKEDFHRTELFHDMISRKGLVFKLINNMKFSFLISNLENLFITSDNPVILRSEGEVGLFNVNLKDTDAKVIFPLTPRICVVLYRQNSITEDCFKNIIGDNPHNKFIPIYSNNKEFEEIISLLNDYQYQNCQRFIYGDKEE